MREEKLFRALGEIDSDLIEQAEKTSITKLREPKKSGANGWPGKLASWIKYSGLVAGVLLIACITAWIGKIQDMENLQTTESIVALDTENSLMNFTIEFDGMGFEGIMGYEMPQQGNPWKKTDVITTLPIFANTTVYKRPQSTEWLPMERYMQMETWLFEIMTLLEMDACSIDRNVTECVAENESIKVTIDGDMHLRIEFKNGLDIPKAYNVSKEATVEETREVAEYVLREYGELFAMENPQITITESDYTFYGERYHHQAYFYEKGDTAKDTLLNYRFSYGGYSLDEEGRLWFVDIVRRDWNVIGEYEVISLEKATEKLLQGEYATSYYGDSIPIAEYIREIELTYYLSFLEDFKPYYKFWVEIPAEKQENGLNTYVAYYVPAIEGAYVDVTFN